MAPEVYFYKVAQRLIFYCCVIMMLAGFTVLEKQSLKKYVFLNKVMELGFVHLFLKICFL